MNEENMMDDETQQTAPSESAFSGMSKNAIDSSQRHWGIYVKDDSTLVDSKELRAVKYGKKVALLIPARMIPTHTRRYDIFEMVIVSADDPEQKVRLYTTHLPGFRRAYLDLALLSAKLGAKFSILQVNRYGVGQFVQDYGKSPPSGLENTTISRSSALVMVVDGAEIVIGKPKLRAYQGMVVLDGILEKAGPIHIQKRVDRFVLRLADHSPVTSIKFEAGGVHLTYSRTNHDSYPHKRVVSGNPEGRQLTANLWIHPPEFVVVGLPKSSNDPYALEASDLTLKQVVANLGRAQSTDEFRQVKGKLGEDMARSIAPLIGLEFVTRHPVAPTWWQTELTKPGPDLLVRESSMDSLAYVEVKWWGEVDEAVNRGVIQAINDMRTYPDYQSRPVKVSYVMVFEWRADTRLLKLHAKRVELVDL